MTSIIPSNPLPVADSRQTVLNLYDQGTKTELFQLKSYVDKAEISSNHILILASEILAIHDSEGVVIPDVGAKFSSIDTSVSDESKAREDADTVLQSNIDAEALTRANRDVELTDLISAEESARISAVSAEQKSREDADSAEQTAREDADNVLQVNINAEKARIDAILAGASIELDTLVEIVNAYQNADTSILSQITTLTSNLQEVANAVGALQQQFEANHMV